MAKRRTYEQKLLDDLRDMPANKFYKIYDRPDFDKLTTAVKSFIDAGEPFEFSNDYRKLKRIDDNTELPSWRDLTELPPDIKVEKVFSGYMEQVHIKGKEYVLEHKQTSYRVFRNGILIAIE